MPLSAGDKLGPYEILAPIGAGGMGDVYKARDTRLDRIVAIKVSKTEFSERFEREARAVAALNHPHICQLYDVGPNYLVMEYIEGAPLKGPLPLDQSLKYAVQICDALDAAHKKGITHRDLKPANILATKTGIKLLDFGLAKLGFAGIGQAAKPPDDTTLTMALTGRNEIVGTLYYMSPEQLQAQANGQEIDARSDIFSFGLVLYEMLTGKRAFEGSSPASVIAAIMERPAPSIADVAPPALDRVLRKCLAKDPDNRWQSARDLKDELEWITSAPESGSAVPAAPNTRSRLGWVGWAMSAVLGLALGALAFIHFRETLPIERTLRYTIAAPGNSIMHSFAISPDGRYVAIAAAIQGKRQLWLRPLDALQSQALASTEDATYPFWSPDSRYIGFFAQGKLKKIAASGGPAQSLCNATDGRGGSWNREDVIVFSPFGVGAAIQRVPAAGGVPTDVTKTRGNYRYPMFLPDGHRFLYVVLGAAQGQNGVYMNSLDGSASQRILPDRSSVAFAAGRLLFIRENTLMAQPFDAVSGDALGDVFPIAEGVSLTNPSYAPITASENGVLLYQSGGSTGNNQIVWFDRAGRLLGSVGAPGSISGLSLSPDEKMMAFSRRTPPTDDIWLRDLVRGTNTRFTFDGAGNFEPFWSPKGDRIVFSSNRSKSQDIYQKSVSGSIQDELLLSTAYLKVPDQWSRDGRFIVYSELDPKTKWDLWVLPAGQGGAHSGPGNPKSILFLQTEFNEFHGQLSPDGRWMAYASDETGQSEVYVRPFPVSDGKWRISTAGGDSPRWRGDGEELFFAGADGKMMAVAVKAVTEPKRSFEAGAPVPLFESHIVDAGAFFPFEYDVTAGGKRFLVNTTAAGASAPPLNVVVNWNAGLKK